MKLNKLFAILGLVGIGWAGAVFGADPRIESNAAKSKGPVFADLQPLAQAAPNKPAAAVISSAATNPVVTLPVAGSNAPSTALAVLNGYVADDKYKLRVGDKISLQIIEDRELPRSLVVTDSGELDAPYIGRVTAAEKTCKQLADDLKTQLEREYYHRATVIISLDAANKLLGKVYVWGQVRNQGPIELLVNETLTAGKAILRVGGFSDFANKKKVKVIRGSGADGTGKQTFELNMVEILEKGKTEKDVVLQPDDLIMVPSRLISF